MVWIRGGDKSARAYTAEGRKVNIASPSNLSLCHSSSLPMRVHTGACMPSWGKFSTELSMRAVFFLDLLLSYPCAHASPPTDPPLLSPEDTQCAKLISPCLSPSLLFSDIFRYPSVSPHYFTETGMEDFVRWELNGQVPFILFCHLSEIFFNSKAMCFRKKFWGCNKISEIQRK